VPTTLHESYAPKGKHLIAVNIIKEHDLDDDELVAEAMLELTSWYGLQVKDWNHIKTYHIKYAMPFKPILDDVKFTMHVEDNLFYAGDALSIGSMEAALRSGRETATNVKKYIDNLPKLTTQDIISNTMVKV
jgi:predicted NAD/FAD-dependent oxidoreductase